MPRVRSIASDLEGSVSIIAAFTLTAVVGGVALAAETGSWYMKQRKLQHAADVAAYSAAVRLLQGDTKAEMEPTVQHVAERSGFEPGAFTLNIPATNSTCAPSADCVEVIVSEDKPRLLTAIFSGGDVTLTGRAVAKVNRSGAGTACVLALSQIAPAAVNTTGNTSVTFNGCEVASNSGQEDSFSLGGSGAMSTTCVRSSGGAYYDDGLTLTGCATPTTYGPAIVDPYEGRAEPEIVGPCDTGNGNYGNPQKTTPIATNYTHPSGYPSRRFCQGLNVKGVIDFAPGLYIIENGDFTVNGSDTTTLNGTGVVFFIAPSASVRLNGNATINLKAPTSGVYSGILFFGDRENTNKMVINGGSSSTMQGAVYFPASPLEYSGNSSSTGSGGCTQIIASTITFIGNSQLGSTCNSAGTSAIQTNLSAALIE
jgi:hypothetical protein